MFWDVLGMPAPGEPVGLGSGLGKKLAAHRAQARVLSPEVGRPRRRACGLCPVTWGQGQRSVHMSIASRREHMLAPGQTARGPPRNSVWTQTQGQALQVAVQVWGQQGPDRWTGRKAQRL